MQVQVVSITGSRGPLVAHCRRPDGQYASFRIGTRAIQYKYVWGGIGAPPKFTEAGRPVQGRSLMSKDETAYFRQYTRASKVHLEDPSGWYDTRLHRYHRWCIENKHVPCGWFNIPADGHMFLSSHELEEAAAASAAPAPWTLVCFDIETELGPNNAFPKADTEKIIGVSLVVDRSMFLTGETEHHVFTLGSCDPVMPVNDRKCVIHQCPNEKMLLSELCEILVWIDPDVVSGWNTDGFDWPYLLRRLELNDIEWLFGRDGSRVSSYRTNDGTTHIRCNGRYLADLLSLWRKEHQERSFKLDNVANAHLGIHKAPVAYSEINGLQKSPQGRARLAHYCLKDSWIVWKLASSRQKWNNALEMSNVTFAPLDGVFSRGQQFKVFSLLSYYAYHANPRVFIPDHVPVPDAGYTGAMVITPKPGLYTDCVATLDFASLYPSIMLAWNMCYSTIRRRVTAWEMSRSLRIPVRPAEVIISYVGTQNTLVQAVPADARDWHRCGQVSFRRRPTGLLPQILESVLTHRKIEKKRMKSAGSSLERAIANGRQLALKLIANSLYGFTGAAEKGMLPAPEIASAVTYQGRKMAMNTMRMCNNVDGCDTIYGDTDSVMIHLKGVSDVDEASKIAAQIADDITGCLPPPNVLEFEKVHRPFLLQKKKRYCGMKYDEGRGPPCLDVKGLEMVRRDNFPLLPNTMRRMVEHIMNVRLQDAKDTVRSSIVHLLSTPSHELDLQELTICRELTREVCRYNSKPPHVRVAERLPGTNVRDRISYLVAAGRGPISDRAYHPSEWDHSKHRIDADWYANQLGTACGRLLSLCVDNIDDVLHPDCNRVIATGSHGICKMLGGNTTMVWRKRQKMQPCHDGKAKRQMTLIDVLKRHT